MNRFALLVVVSVCTLLVMSERRQAKTARAETPQSQTGTSPTTKPKSPIGEHASHLSSEDIAGIFVQMKSGSRPDRYRADCKLRQDSPVSRDAVPLLIEALKDENREVSRNAMWLLERMGPQARPAVSAFPEILRSGPVHLQRGAARCLGAIGAVNKDVVPALIGVLTNPKKPKDVQRAAIEALGRIGPAAEKAALVITLAMINESGSIQLKGPAIRALGRIGPGAKIATPVLMKMFEKPRPGLGRDRSWQAGAALCRMGYASEILPVLIEIALKVEDKKPGDRPERFAIMVENRDRVGAIAALSEVGTRSKRVVPTLLKLLNDNDRNVRHAATRALGTIRPVSKQIINALIKAMKTDGSVRDVASKSLASMGPDAGSAVGELIAMLKGDDAEIRQCAVHALGGIGPVAKEVVPVLAEAIKDKASNVAEAAVEALGELGQAAGPAAPTILKALETKGGRAGYYLMRVLDKMGPAAKSAVPDLVKGLDSRDDEFRNTCFRLLGQIGPSARDAVGALIKASKARDARVCRLAVEALGGIGPVTDKVVPTLTQALYDDSSAVRAAAADALARTGPAAGSAVNDLADLLKDKERSVRKAAVSALGRIGPKAIPAMLKTLKDKDAVVRACSARALGLISPTTEKVVQALIATLKDRDDSVRVASAQALGQPGPAAKQASGPLVKATADEKWGVRLVAIEALGGIGQADKNVVSTLIKILKDEDESLRIAAARALVRIGPKAKQAYLPLMLAMGQINWQRNEAIATYRDALDKLGPVTKQDVPALAEAIRTGSERTQKYAVSKLTELGPAAAGALPVLVKALTRPGGAVGENVFRAIGPAAALPLCQGLKNTSGWERVRILYILFKITPTAKEAVPPLMLALKDDNHEVRRAAMIVLGDMGPIAKDAVPLIIKHLDEFGCRDIRNGAVVEALAKIGPVNKDVIPALLRALVINPGDIRAHYSDTVAKALARLGKPAIAPLLETINSSDEQAARQGAIRALGYMGPNAGEVIPVLIKALKDSDEYISWEAAKALGRMGLAAEVSAPALLEVAKKCNMASENARKSLGMIGSKKVLEGLISMLVRKDGSVDVSIVNTLRRMGPAAAKAVPALARHVVAKSGKPRSRVIKALRAIGAPLDKYVPALIKGLEHKESDIRANCADELAEIGPDAVQAIPALIKTLKDEEYNVRIIGVLALGRIGHAAKATIPELRGLLAKAGNDFDGRKMKRVATEAIAHIQNDAKKPLIGLYGPPPTYIAKQSKAAFGMLAVCLGRGDADEVIYAGWVISGIGPDAAPIVPQLINVWQWQCGKEMRKQFAATFSAIGPAAKAAVPALKKTLEEENLDDEVRAAINKTLKKIVLPQLGKRITQ